MCKRKLSCFVGDVENVEEILFVFGCVRDLVDGSHFVCDWKMWFRVVFGCVRIVEKAHHEREEHVHLALSLARLAGGLTGLADDLGLREETHDRKYIYI